MTSQIHLWDDGSPEDIVAAQAEAAQIAEYIDTWNLGRDIRIAQTEDGLYTLLDAGGRDIVGEDGWFDTPEDAAEYAECAQGCAGA